MLKSFLDILAIASNVITVALFLFNFFAVKNLPMRKKVFSNPYFKVFLFSLIFTGIVFCLPLLCPYFCPKCASPESFTIIKHDTLTKHDTVPKYVYVPVPQKKQPPKYSQKNDSGGSGVQNNGTNNGQQAGRDITNNLYGILPRQVSESSMKPFLEQFPDKHTHIGFEMLGSPNGEMLALKGNITKFLRDRGYDNIGIKYDMAIPNEMPKNLSVEIRPDGSVIFVVPPSQ